MFEVGFSELLLVALVALLVLGPDRLPAAARLTGLWIGRLKRSFNSIKEEVSRELGADEIRQQLRNEKVLQLERDMQRTLRRGVTEEPAASATPASDSAAPTHPADKQP